MAVVHRAAANSRCLNVGVNIDEHLLVDPPRDEDYAGGFGLFVASGNRHCRRRLSLRVLRNIDSMLIGEDAASVGPGNASEAIGGGLSVFTPANLLSRSPVAGDRPYASLVYVGGSRREVNAEERTAVDSTLTIGMLGLGLGRGVQQVLHHITGSEQALGWRHQISAGGEPTARIGIARQSLLISARSAGHKILDLKWTMLADAGMITDLGAAFNLRIGRIRSSWWGYTPEQNTYADDFAPTPRPPLADRWELFAMMGARVRVRGYDALLQGQVRHSDLRYSESALRPVLLDAWIGVQWNVRHGIEVRYLARAQTAELRSGPGSRTLIWGSLEIEHAFCDR